MRSLNIIGCGNLGRTLGRLWATNNIFEIRDILNRSILSSANAVKFLRTGRAVEALDTMRPADVFMISTSDNDIPGYDQALVGSGILRTGNIVFHCSGAISSKNLAAVKNSGAFVGSVHPVKSFADPEESVATFEGTFCGVEGDDEATSILGKAFEAIGGKTFAIDSERKTYYHAATVVVCNYLTVLLEFGVQSYMESGIERKKAFEIMEPIVRGTVDNVFKFDTVRALTGPIARGDHKVVAKQLEALMGWKPQFGELYRRLGEIALQLSREQGTASKDSLAILSQVLGGDETNKIQG